MSKTPIPVGTKVTVTEQNIVTMDVSAFDPANPGTPDEKTRLAVREVLWLIGRVIDIRSDNSLLVQFPRVQLEMRSSWVTALAKV